MQQLTRQGVGLAQMPCALGDTDPSLHRISARYVEPGWRPWVLSQVDLRTTARVRILKRLLGGEAGKAQGLDRGARWLNNPELPQSNHMRIFCETTALQWFAAGKLKLDMAIRSSSFHYQTRQDGICKKNLALPLGDRHSAGVAVFYCSLTVVPLSLFVADPSAIPQHSSA